MASDHVDNHLRTAGVSDSTAKAGLLQLCQQLPANVQQDSNSNRICASILAISVLHTKFSSFGDEYQLIVEKATKRYSLILTSLAFITHPVFVSAFRIGILLKQSVSGINTESDMWVSSLIAHATSCLQRELSSLQVR